MRCRWVRGGGPETGWEDHLIDWKIAGLRGGFVTYISAG